MNLARKLCLLTIISLFSVSCTMDKETEATISLDLDQFNKVSGSVGSSAVPAGFYPELFIVNVHYDGKVFKYEWNCPYDEGALCQLPSSTNVGGKTFPNGTGRIIQVLLVYENDFEELELFYDDATAEFSGGSVDVMVGDNGWENNSSFGQGNVGGRLVGGAVAPSQRTGRVFGYYQPGNGAPRMRVISDHIFSGWFDFMFLQGVNFTYVLPATGEVLFFNKSMDSFLELKDSTNLGDRESQAVHLDVPSHYNYYFHEVPVGINEMVGITPSVIGSATLSGITDLRLIGSDDSTYSTGYMNDGTNLNSLIMSFDYPINLSTIKLRYAFVSGTMGFDIYDGNSNQLITGLAGDATTDLFTFNYMESFNGSIKNASTNLEIKSAFSTSSDIKISDIEIYRKKYHLDLSAPTHYVYGFYDIDTQDFLPTNGTTAGVSWPTALDIANTIDGSESPNVDPNTGSFIDIEFYTTAAAQKLQFAPTGTAGLDVILPSATNPTTNTSCTNSVESACFRILPQQIADESRGLPFLGPYEVSNTVNADMMKSVDCTAGSLAGYCDFSFKYLPGAGNFKTMFLKFQKNSVHIGDQVDCSNLESNALQRLNVRVDDDTTDPEDIDFFAANHTNKFSDSDFQNYDIIACPYLDNANFPNGRKYFGYAAKVHY